MVRDDPSLLDRMKLVGLGVVAAGAVYGVLYLAGSAAERSTGIDLWYIPTIERPAWIDSARDGLEPMIAQARENPVYDRR